MSHLKKKILCFLCAALLSGCFFSEMNGGLISRAAAENSWSTAAEAEAARAEAEAAARRIAKEANKLSAAMEEAEEEAEEAAETLEERKESLEKAKAALEKATAEEKAAAEEKVKKAEEKYQAAEKRAAERAKKAEEARQAWEEVNQQLVEAAMALKVATETSVKMANAERVSANLASETFELGERFSGKFNKERDPIYVGFHMPKFAQVQVKTANDENISMTVLDDTGSTILTLVPSSTGQGSICTLGEGDYTLMLATMGNDKTVTIEIKEYQGSVTFAQPPAQGGSASGDDDEFEFEEDDDEFFEDEDEDEEYEDEDDEDDLDNGMETLVEFD